MLVSLPSRLLLRLRLGPLVVDGWGYSCSAPCLAWWNMFHDWISSGLKFCHWRVSRRLSTPPLSSMGRDWVWGASVYKNESSSSPFSLWIISRPDRSDAGEKLVPGPSELLLLLGASTEDAGAIEVGRQLRTRCSRWERRDGCEITTSCETSHIGQHHVGSIPVSLTLDIPKHRKWNPAKQELHFIIGAARARTSELEQREHTPVGISSSSGGAGGLTYSRGMFSMESVKRILFWITTRRFTDPVCWSTTNTALNNWRQEGQEFEWEHHWSRQCSW